MPSVPKRRTDLDPSDVAAVREAWAAYRAAQTSAERSRRNLVKVLRRLQKRYPVASIARAAKVTPPAVWTKLKDGTG
jgi:hypothetical protein